MKLSVAMCTYNGEKYLKEQINSILNQTIEVHEIIVCDDMSTDTTFSILNEYKENYPLLFIIIRNDNSLGTIKNFEKAISLTSGDLIFLSDQDDIWYTNKVDSMLSFFKSNKNCKLLFSDGDLVDDEGATLKSTLWEKWGFDILTQKKWENNNYVFFELLENRNRITGATICFAKSLKDSLPIIGYPFFYHDAFLGLHAAAQKGLFFLRQSLIQYRVHDRQQVGVANNLSVDQFVKQNISTISKLEFTKRILESYKKKKIKYYIQKAINFLK
jgi:glycosyltransferase involved in cell wall biosynthesis